MSKLVMAIPSKGRLKEQTDAYLAGAGFKLKQTGGDRGYAAELKGVEGVEMRLMSASEIARGVINGDIHIGVTGEDLLRETAPKMESVVHLLKPLGFGFARLIVAAPQSWIDVETMSDLDEVGAIHQEQTGRRMRVATKYMRLARQFFSQTGVGHYRIVESAGATEGAPASGSAELIVDITTTGATLAANGLKIISDGEILASQAQLAASLKADWSEEAKSTLRVLLDSIEARKRAESCVSLRYNPSLSAAAAKKSAAGVNSANFVAPGEVLCTESDLQTLARGLCEVGGSPVGVYRPEYIFEAHNPVFEEFIAKLSN